MRIRSVKPEFFTHPEIVDLSLAGRLLLISLWGQADDEGKLYNNPTRIRANAFGEGDRVNITALLDELEEHGRIIRYTALGRECIYVIHFSRHQKVPATKKKPSSIPPPAKEQLAVCDPAAIEQLYGSNGAAKQLEGTGNREQGTRTSSAAADGLLQKAMFEAVALACGYDLKAMTASERGRTGKAAKELLALGEKPEEVGRFAQDWALTYPDAVLSPQAITNNWSSYCTGRMEAAGKRRRR